MPQQAQYSVMNNMMANPNMARQNNMYNYKTSRCTNFEAGYCKNGTGCNFAHGDHELRAYPHNQQQVYYNEQQMMMYQ